MAFNPTFKMTLQDANGDYYSAEQNPDGSWLVSLSSGLTYLNSLPDKWEDTVIEWQRDTSYHGIFRSSASNNYMFSEDGRGIIQYIRNTQGLKAYATLTIYKIKNDFSYGVFYSSQLDFRSCTDDLQLKLLSIKTLDGNLIRDVHSKGDTKMNIPLWRNTNTTADPVWELDDSVPVLHKGIKLLYSASYTASAKLGTTNDGVGDDPLWYTVSPVGIYPGGRELGGFNHGAVGDGYHILPCMNQYNQVTNNGTTTFIGNDILQPFLIQGNQIPGAANFASESNFSDVNHSQPYTRNNYVLKNILPRDNGTETISMLASVRGTFATWSGLPSPGHDSVGYINVSTPNTDQFISFVLFEIDNTNTPTLEAGGSGRYTYQTVLKLPLRDTTSPGEDVIPSGVSGTPPYFDNTDTPSEIILRYDRAYVFGIIYDKEGVYTDPGIPGTDYLSFGLGGLQLNIRSNFDSGVSGVPIDAPSFPASLTVGLRPADLLSKLVKNLATTTTDGYGFPVPVTTPYEGVSTYLADPSATALGDVIPYQTIFTPAYAMHNLQGQSYISMALNEAYDFFNKVFGCGAYVLDNTFYVERLRDIYDKDTMIIDLGYDVAELRIEAVTDGVGANLKLGYTKADTNKDSGLDAFCTQLYYNTPLSAYTGTMDYQEGAVLCEMYAIEKIRAQRVQQPIAPTYDPSSPSGDNNTIALYCDTTPESYLELGIYLYDPSNNKNAGYSGASPIAYPVKQYPTAQSTDSTALTAPYVYGLRYPDTAINLPLSPCRMFNRDTGAMLHSVLDNMASDYLTFRNITIIQYNNKIDTLSGIESNLEVGGSGTVVAEFKDKLIGELPDPLYKPYIVKVKSKYPVNMYEVLNTNPNGYVRFYWQDGHYNTKEYKFFITQVSQVGATDAPTEFIGVLHPDIEL